MTVCSRQTEMKLIQECSSTGNPHVSGKTKVRVALNANLTSVTVSRILNHNILISFFH